MKPTNKTPVTSYNQGRLGDREYIFAVKGRPFAILSSPSKTTPDFNLIDWALVRDLNLKMSDLQCTKFYFSGHKMRILGKISTTVQCIQDGRIFGNFHIKARVVEDLHTKLDTHGVAGNKLNEQLRAHMSVTDAEEVDELPHTPSPKSKKIKKDDVYFWDRIACRGTTWSLYNQFHTVLVYCVVQVHPDTGL